MTWQIGSNVCEAAYALTQISLSSRQELFIKGPSRIRPGYIKYCICKVLCWRTKNKFCPEELFLDCLIGVLAWATLLTFVTSVAPNHRMNNAQRKKKLLHDWRFGKEKKSTDKKKVRCGRNESKKEKRSIAMIVTFIFHLCKAKSF